MYTGCASGGSVPPVAGDAALELLLRDSVSGAALVGRVTTSDLAGRVVSLREADRLGRVSIRVPRGKYRLKVEAARHRSLGTAFDLEAGATLPVTVWLDPEAAPESLPTESADRPLLQGFVSDAETGKPLSGATVFLERAREETTTDDNGRFQLPLPALVLEDLELPPVDQLNVRREGYRPFQSGELFVVNGTTRFLVALRRGSDATEAGEVHEGHKMLANPDRMALAQSAASDGPESAVPVPEASPESGVAVPQSLRVGFDCQCAACRTVQVFSLETYVKKGLDDEWIPSWHDESLRAGAIAYRSYAVYRVAHPLKANYDICSTICCQMLDPADTHARTDTAAAATTGTIVVNARRDAPFLAEYAAENNGRNCPDGSTGRPDEGWPCIGDPVDAASAFNGHGRGMCQWGTQRWATREHKDHCWIVDHYFNDAGHPSEARSGVMQGPAGRSCP